MPEGLTYNPDTKTITGAPTTPTDKPATVKVLGKDGKPVTNAQGDPVKETFTITVNPKTPGVPDPTLKPGTVDPDEVVNDGKAHPIDDSITNPKKGLTGEVFDKDGHKIDGAVVTVDPSNGKIKVSVPNGTPAGNATVKIKDGKKDIGDPINITITDAKQSPETPGSSIDQLPKECLPAILTTTIPLVLLLPVGLLAQVQIPALAPLQNAISAHIASINKQIEDANTNLQRQLGIYNGPLAAQAKQLGAFLGEIGPRAGQVAGGILAAAAGILAIAWVVDSCTPNADGTEGSSLSSKITKDSDGNSSIDVQGSSEDKKVESSAEESSQPTDKPEPPANNESEVSDRAAEDEVSAEEVLIDTDSEEILNEETTTE